MSFTETFVASLTQLAAFYVKKGIKRAPTAIAIIRQSSDLFDLDPAVLPLFTCLFYIQCAREDEEKQNRGKSEEFVAAANAIEKVHSPEEINALYDIVVAKRLVDRKMEVYEPEMPTCDYSSGSPGFRLEMYHEPERCEKMEDVD